MPADKPDAPNPVVAAVMADPIVQAVLDSSEGASASPTLATPVTRGRAEGQAGTMSAPKPNVMSTPEGKMVAAPTTTEEEDRTTAGQRRVNIIWEATQTVIAVSVVGIGLVVGGRLALASLVLAATEPQQAMANTAFNMLSNVVALVIGFYFGRTNHQRTGGIGGGGTAAGR